MVEFTPHAEAVELAERLGSEAFFRLRLVPYLAYEYISPAVDRILGYAPSEFYRDPAYVREIVVPEDREKIDGLDLTQLASVQRISLRIRHSEGRLICVEVTFSPITEDGITVAVDGAIKETTELKRALAALEGSRRLLADGFDGIASVDVTAGRFVSADAKAKTLLGAEASGVEKLLLADVFDASIGERIATSGALIAAGEMDRATFKADIHVGEHAPRPVVVRVAPSEEGPSRVHLLFEDLGPETLLASQKSRFESAVAAATDAIALFDGSQSFVYVNAAFCRLSGYSFSECVGYRPDILRELLPEHALWSAVGEQEPWAGVVDGLGKGGRELQLEVQASPIREADPGSESFVVVAREVTGEEVARAALHRERASRQRLTVALAALDDRAPAEDIAAAMCNGALALPDVAAAVLVDITVLDEPKLLATRPESGFENFPRRLLAPAKISDLLKELDGREQWVEQASLLGGRRRPEAGLAGATLLAVVPLRHAGATIGLLAALGSDQLRDQTRSLVNLAQATAGLLHPGLTERAERRRIRRELQAMLVDRALRPIFQPIIGLEDLSTAGWEATTHFVDRKPQATRLSEALRVGMAVDVEALATRLAVSEVSLNDPPGWLSLNVSSAFLASGRRLLALLPAPPRQVILSLPGANLDETARRTLGALPANVRIAVDSSSDTHTLRGIVELRPTYIKLPMDIVRDIDGDRVRQALVVGLSHFAKATSSSLIAVGVETEAEFTTLADLGVSYAQGNYLGPAGFFPVADPSAAKTVAG